MDSQIEEIKNKLDIIDVVGSYIKLTKTGINHRGVCPFHKEKSPSFFVSPTRQMWHCFGCGAGSSMFDFVMKIEGVEFGDALRILANKAGVELKRENIQLRTERERLYEICELACLFFQKQLVASSIGKEAEDYLLKRGITQESIKKWRLGYSPDTWNGLSDFLIGKGYGRQEVVKAGLAIEKEHQESDSYDRFRGRIMFPIFNVNSQIVGFGGRVFKQQNETAKYINTPQTLLYDKSSTLYGLHQAKLAIRKQNQCVVTEGYTDVIMCHQAGFENTVAASGTALTFNHLTIIKRYSENLLLAFDMDMAGDSATKRGINLAQEQGFNIKIVEHYGEGNVKSDPADIILKDKSIWEESLAKSKSIMDYYFDLAFVQNNKDTAEGKKEIGKIILPEIKRLQNKIEQSSWVQKLAQSLQVSEVAILEELAKIKLESRQTQGEQMQGNALQDFRPSSILDEHVRKRLVEEKIVALVLKNPDYINVIPKEQYPLFSEKIKNFLEELKKVIGLPSEVLVQEGEQKDIKKILEGIVVDDYEFKNFLAALTLKGDVDYKEDGEEEVLLCLLQLKNMDLKRKLNTISGEIKKAEMEKNPEKVAHLIEEFNTLTKDL